MDFGLVDLATPTRGVCGQGSDDAISYLFSGAPTRSLSKEWGNRVMSVIARASSKLLEV